MNTQSNIKILGTIERKDVIQHLCEAEIGILMNSNDTHSQQYTSPLKYFEYLASELKIVGTNFPSHKHFLILNKWNYLNMEMKTA